MLEPYLNTYFEDEELRIIFSDVIGTDEPNQIYLLIVDALDKYLKTRLQNVVFIKSSIGVVFGLETQNGSKLILKVYSPKITLS